MLTREAFQVKTVLSPSYSTELPYYGLPEWLCPAHPEHIRRMDVMLHHDRLTRRWADIHRVLTHLSHLVPSAIAVHHPVSRLDVSGRDRFCSLSHQQIHPGCLPTGQPLNGHPVQHILDLPHGQIELLHGVLKCQAIAARRPLEIREVASVVL